MRRTTTSLAGAGAIALALALGVAGCTSDTPAPQDVARLLAGHFTAHPADAEGARA